MTGMALVRCILGKFLGVVCHCFPPYKLYDNEIGKEITEEPNTYDLIKIIMDYKCK